MKILDNIKRIRKVKGLSQEFMADKLHIHTINYGKIENGKTALTIERLYQISDILGVTVSEILEEQTEVMKENIILKNENEFLKSANLLVESDRNKVEMAIENWEELKNLRNLVTTFEYIDFIDVYKLKRDHAKSFAESQNHPYILIRDFVKFYFRQGKNNALTEIRKYLDLDKFKESDLILQESKLSGRSVDSIIEAIRKQQSK